MGEQSATDSRHILGRRRLLQGLGVSPSGSALLSVDRETPIIPNEGVGSQGSRSKTDLATPLSTAPSAQDRGHQEQETIRSHSSPHPSSSSMRIPLGIAPLSHICCVGADPADDGGDAADKDCVIRSRLHKNDEEDRATEDFQHNARDHESPFENSEIGRKRFEMKEQMTASSKTHAEDKIESLAAAIFEADKVLI